MTNAVYDDEDQKERISDEDFRASLGISPVEEAEMERAARADEDNGDTSSLTPEELAEREENPDADGDDSSGEPADDLESRFGRVIEDAREKDNFYNGGKDAQKGKVKGKGKSGDGGGLSKRKGLIAGIGGGGIAVVVSGALLFNFLQTFQMDHFMKFLEEKTSDRLSASLDVRNKELVRSYMRVRVTELEGGQANDNLYFRASGIKEGDPFQDWYRTMRSSKFEDDLLKNQGVGFTSFVGKDGQINIAKITGNDTVDHKVAAKISDMDSTNFAERLNALSPEEMDNAFTHETLDSHKAARKSVKEAVNKEIPAYRVFKRRHIRKDIQSKTGIKSWRLFEKTADKVAKQKQAMKDKLLAKIVDRYYVNNPSTAQLLKCLFGDGRCPSNTDPAADDNKTATPAGGSAADDQLKPDENTDVGADGKTTSTTLDTGSLDSGVEQAVKSEVTDVADKEATNAAENATTEAIQHGPMQKITLALVKTISGDAASEALPYDPTKIWTWAKRIAKIDAMLWGVANSPLAKMVINARTSQLTGIYATYQVANDQMKSGQLSGKELNTFFDTTKNLGNTEGWGVMSGQLDGKEVSSSNSANADKKAYCDTPIDKRDVNKFAWFCDDQRPDNGGNAQELSATYQQTVGPALHPIGEVVNALQNNPLGGIVNWISGISDAIMGKALEPITAALMDSSIGHSISGILSSAIMRLLGFLGAGPMFDGTQPGLANLLIAGGASSAEDATRASGGGGQTKESRAYTNELAANYNREQTQSESMFERYASLNNPNSFAASSLFAATTSIKPDNIMSGISNAIASIPKLFGNVVSGKAFAASPQSSTYVSDWSGVKKYDIPQACQNLDPLDPDYLNKSSNVEKEIGLNPKNDIGVDAMRDTDRFWKKVYEKIGNGPDAQDKAEKIYNCALFDARAMGSLGAVYGYDKDAGYDPKKSSSTSSVAGSQIVGDPFMSSVEVACAAGTNDLGTRTGHNRGNPVELRLCGIPNIHSTSEESTPGNALYIEGANGNVIVSSRVSGAVFAMADAAGKDGVVLSARSSFRTYEHQQQLYDQNGHDTSVAASPGNSNHEQGVAIDFNAGGIKGSTSCSGRATAVGDPQWDWLYANAIKFGFKQYAKESWHWDPSTDGSRC